MISLAFYNLFLGEISPGTPFFVKGHFCRGYIHVTPVPNDRLVAHLDLDSVIPQHQAGGATYIVRSNSIFRGAGLSRPLGCPTKLVNS